MASKNRYMIGSRQFLEMDRQPLFDYTRVTYAVSTNVDGASIFLDGKRGDLFQIRTMVDAGDTSDVERELLRYNAMPSRIFQVRYDFRVYGDYLVDSVIPTSVQVLKLVGGVRVSNPQHVIESVWTLYPIRTRREYQELLRARARELAGN